MVKDEPRSCEEGEGDDDDAADEVDECDETSKDGVESETTTAGTANCQPVGIRVGE